MSRRQIIEKTKKINGNAEKSSAPHRALPSLPPLGGSVNVQALTIGDLPRRPIYNNSAAASTTPTPGNPSAPTTRAFSRLNGSTITLNADSPAMSAPPASVLIKNLVKPRIFSRVVQATTQTSATAATKQSIVSQGFMRYVYARRARKIKPARVESSPKTANRRAAARKKRHRAAWVVCQ